MKRRQVAIYAHSAPLHIRQLFLSPPLTLQRRKLQRTLNDQKEDRERVGGSRGCVRDSANQIPRIARGKRR